MGVSENFNTLCNNLRMSSTTVEDISYRYKRITKQLNKDFWNNESDTDNSLFVGSYGRGTDIHASDIDVLFRLPYKKYQQYNSHSGNGQSALLQEVKESIQQTYPSTHKSADGQIIQLNFTDGIKYEILPVFNHEDKVSFVYPDTNAGGSWKATNPKAEIAEVSRANTEWNKNLKRLCRMTRAWRDNWDVPISGILIDTLAYNFLKGWAYKDKSFIYYDFMTRDFFEYLKNQDQNKQYWLAPGSGKWVYRKGVFEHKALQCFNISITAIQLENNDSSAKQKWREIYGTKFPI